jgi:hypothetical protein
MSEGKRLMWSAQEGKWVMVDFEPEGGEAETSARPLKRTKVTEETKAVVTTEVKSILDLHQNIARSKMNAADFYLGQLKEKTFGLLPTSKLKEISGFAMAALGQLQKERLFPIDAHMAVFPQGGDDIVQRFCWAGEVKQGQSISNVVAEFDANLQARLQTPQVQNELMQLAGQSLPPNSSESEKKMWAESKEQRQGWANRERTRQLSLWKIYLQTLFTKVLPEQKSHQPAGFRIEVAVRAQQQQQQQQQQTFFYWGVDSLPQLVQAAQSQSDDLVLCTSVRQVAVVINFAATSQLVHSTLPNKLLLTAQRLWQSVRARQLDRSDDEFKAWVSRQQQPPGILPEVTHVHFFLGFMIDSFLGNGIGTTIAAVGRKHSTRQPVAVRDWSTTDTGCGHR